MKYIPLMLSIALTTTLLSCSEKKTVADYLASAEQYQTENKIKESIIALKNAIQLAPKNAEARFAYGRLQLMRGAGLDAIKELEKAQSLKYSQQKILPLLARAYLISDQYESVIALAENAIELPKEINVEYLSYKTLAAMRIGDKEEAKAAASLANELLNGNPHAIIANAYIALIEDSPETAEILITKSLNIKANNPEAIMLQGQVFSVLNKHKEAAESYRKYLELQPDSKIIYLVLADALMKSEEYSEAEKYADTILKPLPNQPIANYVKAVVRFSDKDYENASLYAEKAIVANYNLPHLKLVAGVSAFYLKNYEQANVHLSTVITQLVPEHPARKMYAVSQFQLGLIDDITETLADFTPTTEEDAQFMSSLGFSLYTIGAKKEAKALVTKAAEVETESSSTRNGVLKLMMNDPAGVESLEKAIEDNPDLVGAELTLAYAAMQSGDFEKALNIAKAWLEKSPEHVGGYNMLAAIYMRKGNIEEAKKSLLISLEKEEDNLFALSEMIKIHYQQGSKIKAKKLVDRAISRYPNNAKVLKYYFSINKSKAALNKISEAYNKNTNDIELRILYMGALAELKEYQSVIDTSLTVPDSIQTPKKVWQLRIFAYQKLEQSENIVDTLNQWIKTNPYHLEPVLLLADLNNKLGEKEKALAVINKALNNKHADSLDLKMIKMQLLLDMRLTLQAKTLFADISNTNIDETIKQGISGRIELLEGDFKAALPKLTAFYEKYPSSQNILLLTITLRQLEKTPEAITLLEKYLETNEQDLQVRNFLANLYISGDHENALKQYEQLVKFQPNNIVALNNLAWFYMERGEHEKALDKSQQAIKLQPDNPQIVDTRAMVLYKTGSKVDAWEVISKAVELSESKNNEILLNYAEILIANQQMKLASDVLDQLEAKTTKEEERKSELNTLILQ